MKNGVAVGIIDLLIGGLSLFFRDRFAQGIVGFQKTAFGFNFGEKQVLANKIVIIIVGSGLVITGILSLFGIIK